MRSSSVAMATAVRDEQRLTRSQTCWTSGLPARMWSGLPGNRDEPHLDGISPITCGSTGALIFSKSLRGTLSVLEQFVQRQPHSFCNEAGLRQKRTGAPWLLRFSDEIADVPTRRSIWGQARRFPSKIPEIQFVMRSMDISWMSNPWPISLSMRRVRLPPRCCLKCSSPDSTA